MKDGKVQRKNRTALSPHYSLAKPGKPVIDRERPGAGYRHVLMRRDVEAFIEILPDWEELSKGLKAIVLAPGETDTEGWHMPGIVAVCAWPRQLAGDYEEWYAEVHRPILDRLDVAVVARGRDEFHIEWTERTVRGYQLMHVLLHELGHHHDRMTTRSQVHAGRGELYAELYANKYMDRIWEDYVRVFGW